jgi:hypothetical protein
MPAAPVRETIRVSDARTLLAGLGTWLMSPDGGVGVAKKIVVVLISLYGLVLAARIVRRLVGGRVGKLPQVSMLLQTFLAAAAYWVVLVLGQWAPGSSCSGAGIDDRRFLVIAFILDPYFTDGRRLVLFLGADYASPDNLEFVWEQQGEL